MSDASAGPVIEVADEATLSLQDRLNFPYVLANQILALSKATAVPDPEYSDKRIVDIILTLKNMIPAAWHDSDYQKELSSCLTISYLDDRPQWCGTRVGINKPRPVITWNHYRLFHALMNLLNRKRLLTRQNYTEVATGRSFESDIQKLEEAGVEIHMKGDGQVVLP